MTDLKFNMKSRGTIDYFLLLKGQIISKGLFDVLEFSQNTNEQIRRSSKNEFLKDLLARKWGERMCCISINFSLVGDHSYIT